MEKGEKVISPQESQQSVPEEEWEYQSPFKKKSQEIAEREKFFGKQLFTPEQVEKARAAVGYPLQELTSHTLGGIGNIAQFLRYLTGAAEPKTRPATSEDVRQQFSEKETFVPKDYEPSEIEKRIGQGAGIAGSLLGTPVPGMRLASIPTAAVAAPAAGAATKAFGAPEWAQVGAENLALIASGLRGAPSIQSTKSGLYKAAKRNLPQGETVGSTSLNNWAQAMRNSLTKQGYNPKNNPLLAKLDDIISATDTGVANVDKLVSLKQSIYDIMGDPELLKSSRKVFPRLTKQINRVLSRYGKQNPKWWENYHRADQLHAGLANSAKATSMFKKYANPENPLTWLVLGAKKTLGKLGLQKIAEVGHRILTNKEMRRYYGNVLKYALQGDARAMNYYVNKLDKKISKEFPSVHEEDEEWTYQAP